MRRLHEEDGAAPSISGVESLQNLILITYCSQFVFHDVFRGRLARAPAVDEFIWSAVWDQVLCVFLESLSTMYAAQHREQRQFGSEEVCEVHECAGRRLSRTDAAPPRGDLMPLL